MSMSCVTVIHKLLPRMGKDWLLRRSIHSCCRVHSLCLSKGQGADGVMLPASIFGRQHLLQMYSQLRLAHWDKGSKDKKGKTGKPKVVLTDDEMLPVIDVREMREDLNIITNSLKETFIKTLSIRSGTGIEDLEVEFDGSKYPLKELAVISRKPSNILVLNLAAMPDALKPVMEAITKSGMNVNPQQDGTTIFLSLPRVTREHREILAKNARSLFLKAKDELAKTMNKYVKEANDAKLIRNVSAELVFNTIENIRYLEKEAVAECERHMNIKIKELLGE